jgi:hypothetical protein
MPLRFGWSMVSKWYLEKMDVVISPLVPLWYKSYPRGG